MKQLRYLPAVCALALVAPAHARTVTLEATGKPPYELGSKIWFVPKLNGQGMHMALYVNGIKGGNAAVGRVNDQNGQYIAPAVMPPGNQVTITARTIGAPFESGDLVLSFKPTLPVIGNISPAKVSCGKPFTLTVTGQRYAADSVVWINGMPAPTAFVSGTKLTATGTSANGGSALVVKVVTSQFGASAEDARVQVGACASPAPAPAPTPTPPPAPTPTPAPEPAPAPPADAAQVAAARFLEQASFGPTPAEAAKVRSIGPAAWLKEQLEMPAVPLPPKSDLTGLRNAWFANMVKAPDQLRQRMVFALSQIFVVSADKNPYANEIQPMLATLYTHAFGNFGELLREVTLNPAMGKYLDLGNSVLPAPNENYAREVAQLFTVGPVLLNQDGSVQRDMHGEPIPSYDQERIADLSRALSGWTYKGPNATGTNWEDFTGPLQPRDAYHDKGAKTLLGGIYVPAGQSTVQDYEAVMDNLFHHPNVAPFIATRLIRHFVKSNPSPEYIARVAAVFDNANGVRGDLAAVLRAVLLDEEARKDTVDAGSGHLKDPMLHVISLLRATNGSSSGDAANLFWEFYLLGQQIVSPPSVFSFYSPLTRLPGSPELYGPEFQIYAPSMAVARASLIYRLLNGEFGSAAKIDLAPYISVAADPVKLVNLVDARLTVGRMTASTRAILVDAVGKISDKKQRALTALYLTAASAEFAVAK